MQGGNRDADIENGLMDTVGEGEGGRNWESRTYIYILPCVKQIASRKLLYSIGSPARHTVNDLEECDGWVGGRFKREGIYVYSLWLIHLVVWQKPA